MRTMRGMILLVAVSVLAGCESSEPDSLKGTYKAVWAPLPKDHRDPMTPSQPFDIRLEFLPNQRVIFHSHRNPRKPSQTPGTFEQDGDVSISFDHNHAAPIRLRKLDDGSYLVLAWGEDNFIDRFVRESKP